MLQPHVTPNSLRYETVQLARRAVLNNGQTANLSQISPWVARSWQRCLSAGAKPSAVIEFEPISAAQRLALVEKNHGFLSAAQTIVDQLARIVSSLGYFALLTDAQGMVVHVAGSIDYNDPASALARVGVDLSEGRVGTSAICAALAELQPVWLHQGEHFFDATSLYTCAGAPIFSPRGECIGMLDLTGIRVKEHRQLKHLVTQAASQIEHRMLFEGNADGQTDLRPSRQVGDLSKKQLVLELSWPLGSNNGQGEVPEANRVGLIRVNDDGLITGACSSARSVLSELDGLASTDISMEQLFAAPTAEVLAAKNQRQWNRSFPLWSGLDINVKRVESATSGPYASAIPDKKVEASDPSVPIREMASAMIRKTINESRGNVNEAARKLGLSRATLYRKLGQIKRK